MIKEAIEKIVILAENGLAPRWEKIDGRNYTNHNISPVKEPSPESIKASTLSSIVEYLKSNRDNLDLSKVAVQILSPTAVNVISELSGPFMQRFVYLSAQAKSPTFSYGNFYDQESFLVALQSIFIDDGDRNKILQVAGNVQENEVRVSRDDGISQEVKAKKGINLLEDVKVPNPVTLAPFRTFIEIEQPSSKFVFRMRSGSSGVQSALFDADGGAWEIEAMASIFNFLKDEFTKRNLDVPIIN